MKTSIIIVIVGISVLIGSIYIYNNFEENITSVDLSYDTPLEQVYEGRIISNQHVKVKPQSYNPVFVMCPEGYFTTGYAKTEQSNDENIFVSYNEIIKDRLYGWQFVFENHDDTPNEFVGYVDCSVIENPEPLEFFQDTNLELMGLEKTRSETQKHTVRNTLTSNSLTDENKIQIINDYITEFQNKEPFVDFFLIELNSQYETDEKVDFTIVEWGKGELRYNQGTLAGSIGYKAVYGSVTGYVTAGHVVDYYGTGNRKMVQPVSGSFVSDGWGSIHNKCSIL